MREACQPAVVDSHEDSTVIASCYPGPPAHEQGLFQGACQGGASVGA